MLSIISFFSFNLEFTNVKKLRAVTFDEFLFITVTFDEFLFTTLLLFQWFGRTILTHEKCQNGLIEKVSFFHVRRLEGATLPKYRRTQKSSMAVCS